MEKCFEKGRSVEKGEVWREKNIMFVAVVKGGGACF